MKNYIPGHFRAITLWVLLLLVVVRYLATGEPLSILGVALLVLGLFLADQATHLAQADHSLSPPTALERAMQKNRWAFVVIGVVVVVVGVVLI